MTISCAIMLCKQLYKQKLFHLNSKQIQKNILIPEYKIIFWVTLLSEYKKEIVLPLELSFNSSIVINGMHLGNRTGKWKTMGQSFIGLVLTKPLI